MEISPRIRSCLIRVGLLLVFFAALLSALYLPQSFRVVSIIVCAGALLLYVFVGLDPADGY